METPRLTSFKLKTNRQTDRQNKNEKYRKGTEMREKRENGVAKSKLQYNNMFDALWLWLYCYGFGAFHSRLLNGFRTHRTR